MIDLASNFNYLGPPKGLKEAINDNMGAIIGNYVPPADNSIELAAAEYFGVDEQAVAKGMGATEILFTLPKMLSHERAVIFEPTFWEYKVANEMAGNQYTGVQLPAEKGFSQDLSLIEPEIDQAPAAVYLCNINNPTGTEVNKAELLDLTDKYPDSDFMVDETYLHFNEGYSEKTLSKEAPKRPNLHVVHSLSKLFAAPGLRAGILISDPDTTDKFTGMLTMFNTPPLAAITVPWLLKQESFIRYSREQHTAQRLGHLAMCRDLLGDDIEFTDTKTNFIFGKVIKPRSTSVADYLKTKGVAVRDGGEWPGFESYFRACIRSDQENKLLLDGLLAYIKEA